MFQVFCKIFMGQQKWHIVCVGVISSNDDVILQAHLKMWHIEYLGHSHVVS